MTKKSMIELIMKAEYTVTTEDGSVVETITITRSPDEAVQRLSQWDRGQAQFEEAADDPGRMAMVSTIQDACPVAEARRRLEIFRAATEAADG